jgi:hypothetical protein
MSGPARSSWWRNLLSGGDASDDEEPRPLLVDPTNELLRQITHVESRIPWLLVGILLLLALWWPILPGLTGGWDGTPGAVSGWNGAPPGPEEVWVERTLGDSPLAPHESAAVRLFCRTVWGWLGVDEGGAADLGPAGRRATRIPSAIVSLVALFVLFSLARGVAGNAAGLLAVCFAAISVPWMRAGSTAIPMMIGEALALAGVARAVRLQARHREVEVPGVSATRIGGAGLLLGLGILFEPANLATLLATVLVWLFLALRRTSSKLTTLPVKSPAETAFFAVTGAIVMVGCALAVGWVAERLAGGHGFPYLAAFRADVAAGREIWQAIWRHLFSPSTATDHLLFLSIPVIALIRFAEWWAGKPWRAAGLLPWVYLALYMLGYLRGWSDPSVLVVPLTVQPLFVLGVGWLVLRGLRPGRPRRQESSFLLVWLGMVLAMVPVLPSIHIDNARLAAFIGVLPPVLIVAGRAGRALWVANRQILSRIAILLFLYVPVVVWAVGARGAWAPPDSALGELAGTAIDRLPLLVLGTIVLAILAELVGVRPDTTPRAVRVGGERSGGRPTGSRRGGRSDSRGRGGRSSRRGRGGSSGEGSRRGGRSRGRRGGDDRDKRRGKGKSKGKGRGGGSSKRGSSGSSGRRSGSGRRRAKGRSDGGPSRSGGDRPGRGRAASASGSGPPAGRAC